MGVAVAILIFGVLCGSLVYWLAQRDLVRRQRHLDSLPSGKEIARALLAEDERNGRHI